MYKVVLSACLMLGSISCCFADSLPPYVTLQLDNLSQQITQLKLQRDSFVKQVNDLQAKQSDPNTSMAKDQLRAKIDELDKRIIELEKQKDALQKQ